jgi:hypothetical protein
MNIFTEVISPSQPFVEKGNYYLQRLPGVVKNGVWISGFALSEYLDVL